MATQPHQWPKGFVRGPHQCTRPGCSWLREVIRFGPRAGTTYWAKKGSRMRKTFGPCVTLMVN
jgi:hypothetical protein